MHLIVAEKAAKRQENFGSVILQLLFYTNNFENSYPGLNKFVCSLEFHGSKTRPDRGRKL